jgi:drug/metabolite transporter (DMT)-like permease
MMGVLFALLAAGCNAFANVMQRRAAALVPDEAAMHARLLSYLLRRPVWYAGMVALLGGFLFQASALSRDRLSVVQPLLIVELPLTLVLASAVFRRRLDLPDWLAVLGISFGLALVMLFADPTDGSDDAAALTWLLAACAVVGLMVALVVIGLRCGGGLRAGFFGAASGAGFGLTAAFMKAATDLADQGAQALVTAPQLYAMVATGAVSLFLAQNAFQAGPLAISQPAITISDPLTSVALGIALFDEQLRAGLALLPEAIGGALIIGGVVVLARSPLVVGERPTAPAPSGSGTAGTEIGTGIGTETEAETGTDLGRQAPAQDRATFKGDRWRTGS